MIVTVLGGKFMSISQKDSVVNEVKAVLGSSYDTNKPAKEQLSDDQMKTVKANVVKGIIDGDVAFKKDTSDEKEIARYVSGMVSNHMRKAKELNGGNTYSPQTSGKGSRDPQVAELSKLLKTYTEGTDEYNQILSAIESRKEEIAAEKAAAAKEKKKQKELSSINMDSLPENLQDLASNLVDQVNG